jgi:hypothetical protein
LADTTRYYSVFWSCWVYYVSKITFGTKPQEKVSGLTRRVKKSSEIYCMNNQSIHFECVYFKEEDDIKLYFRLDYNGAALHLFCATDHRVISNLTEWAFKRSFASESSAVRYIYHQLKLLIISRNLPLIDEVSFLKKIEHLRTGDNLRYRKPYEYIHVVFTPSRSDSAYDGIWDDEAVNALNFVPVTKTVL